MRPAAVLILLLTFAAPARATVWRRPVAGPVARAFAYGPDRFRRGWHRGVDLAAAPGTAVHAACTGTVVTARAVAGAEGVVTLLCGPWRVTHLPLVAIAVRRGAHVHAGARLGVLGRSRLHAGLHLGVRHAGDRFGYVDPMRFLPGGEPPPTPPPLVIGRRGADLGPAPPPVAAAAARAPAPRPATAAAADLAAQPHAGAAAPAAGAHATRPPATAPAPAGLAPDGRPPATAPAPAGLALEGRPPTTAPAPAGLAPAGRPPTTAPAPAGLAPEGRPPATAGGRVRALAPWPAWAGMALLLSGALAGGLELRRRHARVAAQPRAAEGVP